MKKRLIRFGRLAIALVLCVGLSGCDEPRVYGSVGVSSFGGSGYRGGTSVGGSITVGGRIF